MPKSKPLTDPTGEVRELTAADMKRIRPAKQVLPGTLLIERNVQVPGKRPPRIGSPLACHGVFSLINEGLAKIFI